MTEVTADFRHDDPGTDEAVWREALAARSDVHRATYSELLADVSRLVLIAAHPDDDILGAGCLLAAAQDRRATRIDVLVLTDGERSHPQSPTHRAEDLAVRRRSEGAAALGVVAPSARVHWSGLPDSQLRQQLDQITALIVDEIGRNADGTLLVAPWRADGHADHDAAGAAAAAAAYRTGTRLLEYPIWWWHHGRPEETMWSRLTAVSCSPELQNRKRAALDHHTSQTQPLSARPGDEALLQPGFLDHFVRPHECFLRLPPVDESLDRLHGLQQDPWNVADSWYEERKRAVTLAALPRRRYRRTLEVGCSIGRLGRDLAARSEAVLAVDASTHAVQNAVRLNSDVANLTIRSAVVPKQWPQGEFDLIVLSEIGYFLSPAALAAVLEHAVNALTTDGHLLLCHWRHPVVGWPLTAADVHDAARSHPRLRMLASYEEQDFILHVLDTGIDDADRGALR